MRLRRVACLATVAGVTAAGASTAFAVEQSMASASLSMGTSTVAPPTSPTATVNCPNGKKGDVLVRWTASMSAYVTGYTVTRSANGGAASTLASLPATATSYDDVTVTSSTTYTYRVTATYRAWTSAAATVSATTAKHC